MNAVTPQEDQVTLGDRRVETSNFDRYKGRKGVTDRVAILSSTLTRAYMYFYEGGGKKTMFRAPTNPETRKFVTEAIGEPQQRFGLTLFHYTTLPNGDFPDPTKLQGKLKVWVISESRYEELSTLNKQWPLLDGGWGVSQVDLSIKCTEEAFQRMTFTPMPTAHWKTKQAWYEALKAKMAKTKVSLAQSLGRVMKDEEIMALLGVGGQAPGKTDNAGEIDLSDIVDEAPQPTAQTAPAIAAEPVDLVVEPGMQADPAAEDADIIA